MILLLVCVSLIEHRCIIMGGELWVCLCMCVYWTERRKAWICYCNIWSIKNLGIILNLYISVECQIGFSSICNDCEIFSCSKTFYLHERTEVETLWVTNEWLEILLLLSRSFSDEYEEFCLYLNDVCHLGVASITQVSRCRSTFASLSLTVQGMIIWLVCLNYSWNCTTNVSVCFYLNYSLKFHSLSDCRNTATCAMATK